ncbi:MAG: NUDIX domain-containing protein [Bacteroidota bacterium]
MNSSLPNTYNSISCIPVAVDCIIFGFHDNQLELLLIHRGFEPEKGKWSLMGGFVQEEEDLDVAASRVLQQLTGLDDIYMEQVNTFGKVTRDPGGRVISVAYYALIRKATYNKRLVEHNNAQWFSLYDLPEMIFDHLEMVEKAIEKLRQKVKTEPIGFNLLPPKFTLPQLQALYEAILNEPIDKRNFRKKIQSLNILEKLDEKDKAHSKKGAYLFRFQEEAFEENSTFNLY